MSLPEAAPGGGGPRRGTHWHYVATECGQTWNAWSAGHTHWYTCHTKGRSKPCLHAMTGGELSCDKCSPLDAPENIGYVPLYREADGRPVFVCIHEYSREQVSAIRMHACVIVGRGIAETDAVWVRDHPKAGARYQTTLPERRADVDMTESLLKIWKLPALTDWYRRTHGASDKPVALPHGTAVKPNGEAYSPGMQGPAKRWGADILPAEPGPMEAEIDLAREELARRMARSTNGKHTKPKG